MSSDMDPLEDLGSLKRKKGHTFCPRCKKEYNNRWLTPHCTAVLADGKKCDGFLGGKYKPKDTVIDAKMITSTIASVWLNQAGIPVRIFVDLKENKVISAWL
jgi:hypothetical protein